jgi:hypothetical protein
VRFSLCRFKGKRCKRLKTGAPKTLAGKQGANSVRFAVKRLRPGRYRLTATPKGGKAVRVTFLLRR